jgi:hypothetical protein
MTFLELIFTVSTYLIRLSPFSPQLSSITNIERVLISVIYVFMEAHSAKMRSFSHINSQGQTFDVILNQSPKTASYI